MRVVILGGAGIGMIAASILSEQGVEVAGFLNDDASGSIGTYRTYPIIGRTADLPALMEDPELRVFVAYVHYRREQEGYDHLLALDIPRERLVSAHHQSASCPVGHCDIGAGVLLAAHATLSPDTSVADNCILMAGSRLGHNSRMDRFARMALNATIGARVHVGRAAHVGLGAVVREDVTIGDYAMVGAGSVVLEDVPEGAVVVGNPARVLRSK